MFHYYPKTRWNICFTDSPPRDIAGSMFGLDGGHVLGHLSVFRYVLDL